MKAHCLYGAMMLCLIGVIGYFAYKPSSPDCNCREVKGCECKETKACECKETKACECRKDCATPNVPKAPCCPAPKVLPPKCDCGPNCGCASCGCDQGKALKVESFNLPSKVLRCEKP